MLILPLVGISSNVNALEGLMLIWNDDLSLGINLL
jgi:hypothetical protein